MRRELDRVIKGGIYTGAQPVFIVCVEYNGTCINSVFKLTKGMSLSDLTRECKGFRAYSTKREALAEANTDWIDPLLPDDVHTYEKSLCPVCVRIKGIPRLVHPIH